MDWNKYYTTEQLTDLCLSFLREAYQESQLSDDPTTHTGSIIVRPGYRSDIIAKGHNHLPKGLIATEEQLNDSKWKYKYMIHAEPASIHTAAQYGRSTKGTVMYMPWVPCTDCAKVIIDSGVHSLVGHKELIIQTPERWNDTCIEALELLANANVELIMYSGKIGGVKHRFNGTIWEP